MSDPVAGVPEAPWAPAAPGTLDVLADLSVEVSGPAGSTTATVRSHDGELHVDVADPTVAARSLPGGPLGGFRTRVAAQRWARATGVAVEVHGPRGLLARVDPLGSSLGAGFAPALAAAGRDWLLRHRGPLALAALALSGLAALVALARRR